MGSRSVNLTLLDKVLICLKTLAPGSLKLVSEERLIFYTIKLQDTATILPVSDAFFIYIFTKLHYHERFRHNFWPSSGISKLVK